LIENFKNGFPFLNITAPATPGNGIKVLDSSDVEHYVSTYPKQAASVEVVKFVPASGAASRMFKDLFGFLEGDGDLSKSTFVQKFMNNIEKFAFYDDLNQVLKSQNSSINQALDTKDYKEILAALLVDDGLGYGNLPKGLLRFHSYPDKRRTPAHEHLIEGVQYALGSGNKVKIHFTVSPEHESKFKSEIDAIVPGLSKEAGVAFEITYSTQKKRTDTIAVDSTNDPFWEEDGSILFRPAGHGALLENLNDISADLIFIKNIDNVVPDQLKEETKNYKMAIGGLLLEIQSKVFGAVRALENSYSKDAVSLGKSVFTNELGAKLPENFNTNSIEYQGAYLKAKLNRPIRVCGMVKNTATKIVFQPAMDPESQAHMNASTHFNPVDLVCGTRNYKGESFDLLEYRDMKTGFITEKSKSGRELKALELPGLWNGSMAGWNTIFVEVPLITFNPVKTVNDLLRDEHQ